MDALPIKEILIGLISAFLAVGIERALHKEKLLAEKELEFRERQLEEFYGPIYASLKLSSMLYPLWLKGFFQEVNKDIIELFRKQNDDIVRILKTKMHLADGGECPPEFVHFMTSVTIWGMYCTRPNEPWLPPHVQQIEAVQWPKDFEHHIYTKTEELKQRLDTLLRQHSIVDEKRETAQG